MSTNVQIINELSENLGYTHGNLGDVILKLEGEKVFDDINTIKLIAGNLLASPLHIDQFDNLGYYNLLHAAKVMMDCVKGARQVHEATKSTVHQDEKINEYFFAKTPDVVTAFLKYEDFGICQFVNPECVKVFIDTVMMSIDLLESKVDRSSDEDQQLRVLFSVYNLVILHLKEYPISWMLSVDISIARDVYGKISQKIVSCESSTGEKVLRYTQLMKHVMDPLTYFIINAESISMNESLIGHKFIINRGQMNKLQKDICDDKSEESRVNIVGKHIYKMLQPHLQPYLSKIYPGTIIDFNMEVTTDPTQNNRWLVNTSWLRFILMMEELIIISALSDGKAPQKIFKAITKELKRHGVTYNGYSHDDYKVNLINLNLYTGEYANVKLV
jgi:hypothetical protein